MRMWMVNPSVMCRQHLLGEHVELHMLAGSISAGISITGYLQGLVMPHEIKARHDVLVKEMLKRSYNHHTPIFQPNYDPQVRGWVDPYINLSVLRKRCSVCRSMQDRIERL